MACKYRNCLIFRVHMGNYVSEKVQMKISQKALRENHFLHLFQGAYTSVPRTLMMLLMGVSVTVAQAQEAFDEDDYDEEEMLMETSIEAGVIPSIIFSAEELENSNLRTNEQLADFVRGADYASGTLGMGLRGIGSFSSHPGASSSLSRYEDGIYVVGPTVPAEANSFLSQRIDLMLGAQDTTYGRNAVNGAVDRISNNPNMDSPVNYRARLNAGQFGLSDLGISVDGALTDLLGYSLTALDLQRDGVVENVSPDAEDVASQGTSLYEVQVQLGHGDSTHIWWRFYSLEQDSLPSPLVQLGNYHAATSASDYERSRSPYYGYTEENPVLEENRYLASSDDYVLSTTGENLAYWQGSDSAFFGNVDPSTLQYIDNLWLVNQNFEGSESVDKTDGHVLNWDWDWGESIRFTLVNSFNRYNYARTEDGDRVNNTAVDLRTSTSKNGKSYSNELRLGSKPDGQAFAWSVGSYRYNEESSSNITSYDEDMKTNTPTTYYFPTAGLSSAVDSTATVPVTAADLFSSSDYAGLISDYYTEMELSETSFFASLAWDFGIIVSLAVRTTETTQDGKEANLTGYTAGSSSWVGYRSRQWEALRSLLVTDAGEAGIQVDAFNTALAAAGVTVAADTDLQQVQFFGTDDISTYIEVLDGMVNCAFYDSDCGDQTDLTDPTKPSYNAALTQVVNATQAMQSLVGASNYTLDYTTATPTLGDVAYVFEDGLAPVHAPFHTAEQESMEVEGMHGSEMPETIKSCLVNGNRQGSCHQSVYEGDSLRASVELPLGGSSGLYFSSLAGYKSGGYLASSDNGVAKPFLAAEEVTGVESGLKVGAGAFQLNLSIFDYEYTNMQSVDEYLRADGILYQAPFNIPTATVAGTGLEVYWQPWDWFALNFSATTLDTEAGGMYDRADIAGGGTYDLTGNALPYAPELQWATNLRFNLTSNIMYSVSYRYQDQMYFTAINSPYAQMPEHTVVDARLVIRSSDDQFRVTVYGENLERTVSWDYAVEGRVLTPAVDSNGAVTMTEVNVQDGPGGSVTSVSPNARRTIGVQFDFRF